MTYQHITGKNQREIANKVKALEELGLTDEPTCMACGGPAPFDSHGNCRGNNMEGRVASAHGWKKYCSLSCKHSHCHTASDAGNKKKSQTASSVFVLELPDGKQIIGKGLRSAAAYYGFHVPNMIQQGHTKGYRMIDKDASMERYPNLEFIDFTEEICG